MLNQNTTSKSENNTSLNNEENTSTEVIKFDSSWVTDLETNPVTFI